MQHPLQQFGFLQKEEWILETREPEQAHDQGWKFNVADLSLLKEFWWNTCAHVFLTAEADSLPTDTRQLLWRLWLGGMPLSQKTMTCQSMQEWIPQVMFAFFGHQLDDANEFSSCSRIFEVKIGQKPERAFADLREQTADTPLWPWNCCISHWRQQPQHHWGHSCAYCKMYSRHQREATGDQIKSSETTMLCMPPPSWASNECGHLIVFVNFSQMCSRRYNTTGLMLLWCVVSIATRSRHPL